jgi:acetyltransferase EpsM
MPAKLIIVGGGEHARVVSQVANSRRDQWEVEGFVSPQPGAQIEEKMDIPRLGTDMDLQAMVKQDPRRFLVLGVGAVGNSELRRQIVKRFLVVNSRWASVIDSSAQVSTAVCIGNGVVIMPGALINCGATLGDHCIVNTGAIIEHDVKVGAFVQVAPGVVIGGGAVLESGAYIGLGARVRDHVTVGAGAIVGMGAAVVSHVPAGVKVMGVPARVRSR